jgi:hypothetical protein
MLNPDPAPPAHTWSTGRELELGRGTTPSPDRGQVAVALGVPLHTYRAGFQQPNPLRLGRLPAGIEVTGTRATTPVTVEGLSFEDITHSTRAVRVYHTVTARRFRI